MRGQSGRADWEGSSRAGALEQSSVRKSTAGEHRRGSQQESRAGEQSRRAEQESRVGEQSRRAEWERRLWRSFKLSLTKNPLLLNNISWVY